MTRVFRILRWVAIVAAVGWTVSLAVVWAFQRDIIYQNGATRHDPARLDVVALSEHVVRAPDGAEVVVWAGGGAPDAPVIVYFHGNAGTLGDRAWRFRRMLDRGWAVVGVGLRGGSGTTGAPSEPGLIMDALAVHDALPGLLGRAVPPGSVVPYGESLGTGPAVALAANRAVGAVVLETPFAAVDELAQGMMPHFPILALGLVKDRWRSVDRIAAIDAPLLVLHGTRDRVIPYDHALALMEAAEHPKWLRTFEGGRHYDLWSRGALEKVAGFVDRYVSAPPPATPPRAKRWPAAAPATPGPAE